MPQRTAIQNVRIFDGQNLSPPSTVIIARGLIESVSIENSELNDATLIDGKEAVLLPGLIDAHIHLHGPHNLHELANWGVTTGLDMATWPPSQLSALRVASNDGEGVTDIRSPGAPACAPNSRHSQMPGFPTEELVANEEEAVKFVEKRVGEGVDYVKMIADVPGFEQGTLNALAATAKKNGKQSIAHAAQFAAYQRALEARVDIITHVPLDKPLDTATSQRIISQGAITVPTLTMMETIFNNLRRPGSDYSHSRDSVTAMYKAGVPILAGTDANAAPGAPVNVKHGESLHHELELLVAAGVSNLDALRAATILPAKWFGLSDRGVVEVGKRADLVLVEGDPLLDIRDTKRIVRVWCKGVEVDRK